MNINLEEVTLRHQPRAANGFRRATDVLGRVVVGVAVVTVTHDEAVLAAALLVLFLVRGAVLEGLIPTEPLLLTCVCGRVCFHKATAAKRNFLLTLSHCLTSLSS